MSTRCMVAIRDEYDNAPPILFYRHCDGYPEGVKPSLDKLCDYLKRNLIRSNAEQCAGWLVMIGAQEYAEGGHGAGGKPEAALRDVAPTGEAFSGWKIGAYEPAQLVHVDIEYLHVVRTDLARWGTVHMNLWNVTDADAALQEAVRDLSGLIAKR